MKFAIAVVLYWALQAHVPSTLSVSQCNIVNQYAPINVDTGDAIQVVTPTPLTFVISNNEPLRVRNTGSTLEITSDQLKSVDGVCGGILGIPFYKQHKIRFYWNNDFREDCCYSLDQSGYAFRRALVHLTNGQHRPKQPPSLHTEAYPLNIEFVYYKSEYGFYSIASTRPYGIVVVRASVTVEGNIPNPKFARLESILRNLTKAGSSSVVSQSIRDTIYSWFDVDSVGYPYYYTYSGLYKDQDLNATSYSEAIYIVGPRTTTGHISTCQFTAFTDLKTATESPIVANQPAFGPTSRTIRQAAGLKEIIF